MITKEQAQEALENSYRGIAHETAATGILEDYITQLEAELDKHKWQPISTAPRDGTQVLLTARVEPSYAFQDNGGMAYWAIGIGMCFDLQYDKWTGITGGRPHLWMPLPQPPEETNQ